MKDPLVVLKQHLYKARDERDYHKRKQLKNNIEVSFAGHKMMWLRQILFEITGELIPLKELNKEQ